MWNIAHNLGGFTAPILAGTAARSLGWKWGVCALLSQADMYSKQRITQFRAELHCRELAPRYLQSRRRELLWLLEQQNEEREPKKSDEMKVK